LKSLAEVLPIEKVYAYDHVEVFAGRFADEMSAELKIEVIRVTDLSRALEETDVCVTCTSSTRPFLMHEHVRAGTFVAAVGADNPRKQELESRLLASNKVVVDILDQCAAIGDLHHAVEAGVMNKSDVYAELGAIVAGRTPGRTSAEEVIIFDSTGTALQDVAAASIVYQRALNAGKGTWLNLAE
jgi:ornithine cyclodeaminase/alanine dehydrogenase-like protein (mu-crystallin family)